MKRREFIAGAGAGTALLLGGTVPARAAANPLAYPPLLDATKSGEFTLDAQAGELTVAGEGTSPTWGFNQSYMGPTVRATQRPTKATVINNVDEVISVHWHGLIIPGDVDGGPHQTIAQGATWLPELDIVQPEATLWYHSHIHGETGQQVYRGLAGVLQIADGQDEERGLPDNYGIDDLTIVLQDRRFDWRGRMTYSPSMPDRMHGFQGDTMLINGQSGATAAVPKGIVRLRLLNGSNARIYNLFMNEGHEMHLIATDSGLLPEPMAVSSLVLAPGERVEVLVDFSDGNPDIMASSGNPNAGMMGGGGSSNFGVLPFEVDDTLPAKMTKLPGNIGGDLPDLNPEGAEKRSFALEMGRGGMMMRAGGQAFSINGQSFDMKTLNFSVARDVMQHWTISSDMLSHPFHVHGVRFQVLNENGRSVSPQNRGWKDTVLVNGQAEILLKFDRPATENLPYMYHCHILEHEDGGMMGQFAVT